MLRCVRQARSFIMYNITDKRRRNSLLRFVLLILILILVVRFIFPTFGYPYLKRVVGPLGIDPRKVDTEEIYDKVCPVPHLRLEGAAFQLAYQYSRSEDLLKGNNSAPPCRRLQPLRGSCQIAEEIFHGKDIRCATNEVKTEICKIEGSPGSYTVHCNINDCDNTDSVSMGTPNAETAETDWMNTKDMKLLEQHILQLMKDPTKNLGYCFLSCGALRSALDYNVDYYIENLHLREDIAIQLLILPPDVSTVTGSSKDNKYSINLNVIFIDSVSRHHFFRSLPETVGWMENLSKGHNPSYILDFEHMQAVRSRTYESLQALFSGYVNPAEKPFGTLAMPPKPLRTETLFKPFKDAGYHTLWLEDLCYLWEWGISKDLLVHNKSLTAKETRAVLLEAFQVAGIDSFGMSYAQCQVLQANFVNDHFHGPDSVCYSGRHQHEYQLEYLSYYQQAMQSVGRPYISFFQTNVGHEDTGRRIQLLDSHLTRYLQEIENHKNTMTILFSDHGNNYGSFVDRSMEGKVETFHPFLFMIIPKDVQKIIGASRLNALVHNQDRLVTLKDLHNTLMTLLPSNIIGSHSNTDKMGKDSVSVMNSKELYPVNRYGLFEPISETRSCDDLPLIMPNLCICEGHEEEGKNDSYHRIVALFAVGMLNNEIIRQQRMHSRSLAGGFGNCHRIGLKEIQHVRESRIKGEALSIKLDILMPTEKGSPMERIFVAVNAPLLEGRQLRLLQYQRMTPYSKFGECGEKRVDLQLCMCNLTDKGHNSGNLASKFDIADMRLVNLSLKFGYNVFDIGSTVKCFYIFHHSNDKGVVFEAVNTCGVAVKISFTLSSQNLALSSPDPSIIAEVYGGDVKFLMAAIEIRPNIKWKWTYDLKLMALLEPHAHGKSAKTL